LAADADRRELERTLHDGVQQHLIALAVNLQLAGRLADADLPAAKALLEEMERDAQQALDEAAQLAQRIYPALLEAGSLAAALRSAAASAGISASIEVTSGARYSPEVAATVYLCCQAAIERAAVGTRATLTVREAEKEVVFEIVADGAGSEARLEGLRDRVAEWATKAGVIDRPDVQRTMGEVTAVFRVNELLNWEVARAAAVGEISVGDASSSKVFAADQVQHLSAALVDIVHRYGDPSDEETDHLMTYLDGQAKRNLVLTFGGGVQEVQRELIAMFGLGLPRVPR
jgi:hypothetical protein